MLNLVLFGPPGAGKGTQSEKLINAYQLVHLSTGDILRGEVAAQTPLGIEAKKLMDQGLLCCLLYTSCSSTCVAWGRSVSTRVITAAPWL